MSVVFEASGQYPDLKLFAICLGTRKSKLTVDIGLAEARRTKMNQIGVVDGIVIAGEMQ
jgi:hypothetical protein